MIWGLEGRHAWIPGGRNLIRNSRFLVGTSEWTPNNLAVFARVTGLAATENGTTTGLHIDQHDALGDVRHSLDVLSGSSYTVSLYARPILLESPTTRTLAVHNAGGTQKGVMTLDLPGGVWTRNSLTFTADSTGTWTIRVEIGSVSTGEVDMYLTDVQAERGSVLHDFSPNAVLPLPTETPLLTLNKVLNDAGARTFPHYKLDHIGGLAGVGDSGDVRDNRVGAQGEIPRRSFRRGKTITYEGRCMASTRAELRTSEANLRAAFTDQEFEGLVVVTPHPIYDNSGAYRYFPARALACEIDDKIETSPRGRTHGHESKFVLAVRNARHNGFSYYDQSDVGYP